ncbi:hypothetical protein JVU11DRAFT_7521 [Chiua virens]|nr:hypothetical protein JVU11DRAFT_7521 [Chiua virens]
MNSTWKHFTMPYRYTQMIRLNCDTKRVTYECLRGPEERKKRWRKLGSSRKGGGAQTVVKVSQRLLGPATLGVLLEENDDETREYTDMEIGRIHVYAAVRSRCVVAVKPITQPASQIAELTFMRALHRTSATDKLDSEV